MTFINTIFIVLAIILTVLLVIYYAKCKHRVGKIFAGVGLGLALLYPASYLLSLAGATLTINFVTLFVSASLGVAGVILLCVCSLF